MPHEIELKFAVAPGAMERLVQSPWFKKLSKEPPKSEKVVSVYYDTAKSKLRKHGLSLRVRRAGDKCLQTVKADGTGGVSRQEWEREIRELKPDFGLARRTALKSLLSRKLERKLKPVFETSVERTSLPVNGADSIVEIALDRGRVKTRGHSAPISEIEVELKDGDPAGVVAIAEQLSRKLPLRYLAKSKAERGYALEDEEGTEPVCAEEIPLDSTCGTAEAFRRIGFSCLRHLSLNEAAIREEEGEGVHQMRVGLRRLRAAMSVFKDLLEDAESRRIKAELKWLTAQLGPARDLDVFVTETIDPMEKSKPAKKELPVLKRVLEEKRKKGFDRAKKAVESERYRRLVVNTALWLSGGKWHTAGDDLQRARRDRPVPSFADDALSSRTRKVAKRVKKLEELNPTQRHKLRIAAKKLRYATEFFADLWPDRGAAAQRKQFGKALKELQRALGTLNDIMVHERLGEGVVHAANGRREKARETAFAMGLVTGKEQADIRSLTADATAAGKRLGRLPRYWRS